MSRSNDNHLADGSPAALKFEYDAYLQFDPCEGVERDLSDRTVRLLRAKKDRACFMGLLPGGDRHSIARGSLYRSERAKDDELDGSWAIYAVCLSCIEAQLAQKGHPPASYVEPGNA